MVTYCGESAAGRDPMGGCRAVAVPGSARCLAHCDTAEQSAYVTSLFPGAELDLEGTTLAWDLLRRILVQVTDPATEEPVLGTANFHSVTFTGPVAFTSATFTGGADFSLARFTEGAGFSLARFMGDAHFGSVVFAGEACFQSALFARNAYFGSSDFGGDAATGDAVFTSATFTGEADFDSAAFTGEALFGGAAFAGHTDFSSATFAEDAHFGDVAFSGNADFDSTTFARDADFDSAVFERASALGPLVCGRVLDLSRTSFEAPVTVEVAARQVVCRRTRWAATATLWVRYADTDLADAVFEYPLAVAGRRRPFINSAGTAVDESILAGDAEQARAVSLRGVDAAHLVLTDLDLSACLFAGTIHLDQLRLEGDCLFGTAPPGVHLRGRTPLRHTHRSVLAEEQHWRHSLPGAHPGWLAVPPGVDVVQPAALAAVYRALRKSYEDSSNEPGAADFYYGEMQMRRADSANSRSERRLLSAYWALSGYGLRAARALAWLLAAVTVTLLVMMLWGVPANDTPSRTTGTVSGRHITLTTDRADPVDSTGPMRGRLTGERFEKSLRTVVNSVIFRSSGQDLTTTGTYMEMASRLTEPALLGLAVLAVRGRVKR